MDTVGDLFVALLERARPGVPLATLLCEEVAERVGADGAALAVMSPPYTRVLVGSTGPATAAVHDAQYVTGEGPCVEAFTSGRLVLVDDLDERRTDWPAFAPTSVALGIVATFAFPVQIGGIRLGVLEVHRGHRGPLSDASLSTALRFVDVAAHVLLQGREGPGAVAGSVPRGGPALDVLDVAAPEVHQATGMVSVQAQVPLDQALLLLRARAFAEGRPLREVALDVVARRTRLGPGPPSSGAAGGEHDEDEAP